MPLRQGALITVGFSFTLSASAARPGRCPADSAGKDGQLDVWMWCLSVLIITRSVFVANTCSHLKANLGACSLPEFAWPSDTLSSNH